MIRTNFYILAPYTVTGAELLTAPPDVENGVYDPGRTYAAGELVWFDGKIWRSDSNGNNGNTPGVAEWTDLGIVDKGAGGYDAGNLYSIGEYAVYQSQLWQSAENSNLGNTPSVTGTEWTRIGATNRFKAFDSFLQDEATVSGGFKYTVNFTPAVTQIAILRGRGANVNVVMRYDLGVEIYNKDFSFADESLIVDWWAYFFEPIIQTDTILIEDLPNAPNSEIDITFTGLDTGVGQILFGVAAGVGTVKIGTSVGIESYSVKTRDEFNRYSVVARPFSDTVDFDIAVPTLQTNYFKRLLSQRDALPTLYYMSGGEPYGAVAYGFYKNFDILHSTHVISDCVLEIEGLG